MNYKLKSILIVAVLALFMATVALFINNLEGEITGAIVKPVCECNQDSDCNDNDSCTEDICLYADDCEASICIHNDIENL